MRGQQKYREASLLRADGVVAHKPSFKLRASKTHFATFVVRRPPRPLLSKEASRRFLDVASTPPSQGGEYTSLKNVVKKTRIYDLVIQEAQEARHKNEFLPYQLVVGPRITMSPVMVGVADKDMFSRGWRG